MSARVGVSPEREDRLVLEQEERLRRRRPGPVRPRPALESQGLVVADPAEPDGPRRAGGPCDFHAASLTARPAGGPPRGARRDRNGIEEEDRVPVAERDTAR